jgi:hypothetical protein
VKCEEEAAIFQSVIGKFSAVEIAQTASARFSPSRKGQTASALSPAGGGEVEKNDA